MAYFNNDYVKFFKELSANNNRDWFQANKKRYEKSVKDPFNSFVQEMIKEVKKVDPNVNMEAKEAVFRINRDIRFSSDKTPYKTHMSALISAGGKKDKSIPGLFMQLSAEGIQIYSGVHAPEKDALMKIRSKIVKEGAAFSKMINAKPFKATFGSIMGDKNKRLPTKDLQAAAEKQPLVANKDFLFGTKLPAKAITQNDLPGMIMKKYKDCAPLRKFLTDAL